MIDVPIFAEVLRNELIDSMGRLPEYSLCLSGGVDSSVLLYSALEANNPPKECVTFLINGNPNADYKATSELCKYYSIPLVVSGIKADNANILQDSGKIIEVIGQSWKAHVQTCYPFKYMAESISTKVLVSGTWADHYCYLKKAVNIARTTMNEVDFEKWFTDFRNTKWSKPNQSCNSIKTYAESCNKGMQFIEPYKNDFQFELALTMTFREWNMNGDKVKHKYLWYKLYKKWFDKTGIYRPAAPLQIVTGIRDAHEKLLLDPSINKRNNKDLVGIYNDIKNEAHQTKLI